MSEKDKVAQVPTQQRKKTPLADTPNRPKPRASIVYAFSTGNLRVATFFRGSRSSGWSTGGTPSKKDFKIEKLHLHHKFRTLYYSLADASSTENDLCTSGALNPVGDSSNDTGTSHSADATKAGWRATPEGSAEGAGSSTKASSPARTVLAHEQSAESAESAGYGVAAGYGGAADVDFDRARAAPPDARARRLLRMGKPGAREKPPPRDRTRFPLPL